MQVAYIPAKPTPTASQKQQSTKPEQSDFLDTLSKKLGEVKAETADKKVDKTEQTATPEKPVDDTLLTPQVVEIPITQAMQQLMAAFAEQSDTTVLSEAITTTATVTDTPVSTNVNPLPILESQVQPKSVDMMTVSPNTVTMPIDENALVAPKIEAPTPIVDANPVDVETKVVETKPVQVTAENQVKSPATAETIVSTLVEPVIAPKSKVQTTEVTDTNTSSADVLVKTDVPVKVSEVSSKQASNTTDESPADDKKGETATPRDTATFELQANKSLVKISDSATKLDAPKVQTPQTQLADTLKTNLQNGRTEFEMQLTPVNLGKITVKMVSENGMLTVEFLADNPKTQSMLMSSISEIRDLIQGSVNPTTQVVTPNHGENLPQNYTQQQNQQNQQEQNNQEQQSNNNQNNHQEQSETTTVDFLTVLQQLKEQSRLTRA